MTSSDAVNIIKTNENDNNEAAHFNGFRVLNVNAFQY